MTDSHTKNFKVRNNRHAILGIYSEAEIIDRINRGKYQGSEEVSSEPFLNWQKLSSHPVFYDAFLKRLFIEQYRTPDGKEKNRESVSAPRIQESIEKSIKEADSKKLEEQIQATQQLEPGNHELGQPFPQLDEIDKLFLTDQPEKEDQEDQALKEAEQIFEQAESSVAMNLHEVTENNRIDRQILFDPGLTSERLEDGTQLESEKSQKTRKRILVAGIALALSFLYLMGQSVPEPAQLPTGVTQEAELGFKTEELKESQLKREELVSALLDEASHFYDFDTPLHYSGAEMIFKEAVDLNRQDPAILAQWVLSKAHLIEQDPKNEKRILELNTLIRQGRELEPQLNAFYRAEAILAFAQKNIDLAVEKIGHAQESDPLDEETATLEAEFLNENGDRNTAYTKILNVVNKKPTKVRPYYVAALIALDSGDLENAEKFAAQALLINPMHANTHYVLGEVYLRNKKSGAAVAYFDLVTKLAPLASRRILADAHFALAKLLETQGNTSDSAKHNKLAFYFSNGLITGVNEKLGSEIPDIDSLKGLAKEQEYDSSFYSARAEEFINDGNSILGLEYLQVVRLLRPNEAAPLIKVAEVLEKLAVSYEKLKRIEVLYLRAIKKDPYYMDSYSKLAMIETEQYNFDSAYKLLSKAAELMGVEGLNSLVSTGCRDKLSSSSSDAKDEYKVYLALGKHFFKRENYVCAATFLKQARTLSPVNADIFYYFGKLTELYNAEALPEAARYYFQAVSTDGTNYEALAGWAKVKTRIGEKNYVIKYLRALIENDSKNAYLYWALGETYSENQEYRRAITFYKKALDYNSRFSKARISMARALSAVGQTYQAINEYTYAASADRRNGIGFFEAAQLQTINKNYQDAELLVRALIEATPNYPGSHRLLSQIYQFQGRKDEALAEMIKEVENNPQNIKFLIELAEVYMKYQKFDKAVGVLSKVSNLPGEIKAPEFRADRTQAFLLLSRCYRELNRPESAEGVVKLALEIDSNDPELHREMGYVYLALQRFREGVKEFEIYLQRNPAGADVENLKKLIKTVVIEE